VQVDLPSSLVSHDEASRDARLTTRVVMEASVLQGRPRDIEVVAVEREVEVGMPTRLVADEGVDTPSSIHPCVDADGLERVQYLDYVSTSHVPSVASDGHVALT
jgi:hypothetical protein